MKNEVAKILEMIKAGTLTEEQGAKLLDEIYLQSGPLFQPEPSHERGSY